MSIEFKNKSWSWDNLSLYDFLLEGNVPSGWEEFFEKHSEFLYNISNELKETTKPYRMYPLIEKVFRAFIQPKKIKVVLLGQDPYYNGNAVGLCFSIPSGARINPSLMNIYKELSNSGYNVKKDGDLSHWKNQGVFMINTALTVEKNCAGEHLGIWYKFIEKVLEYISDNIDNVCWLLMGSKALDMKKHVGNKTHELFITSHPVTYTAYKPLKQYPAFIGSNVFKKINTFLKKNGKTKIKW